MNIKEGLKTFKSLYNDNHFVVVDYQQNGTEYILLTSKSKREYI